MADKIYCCYCGIHLIKKDEWNREHLIPKSKGGNDSEMNLKTCCKSCNTWRNNTPLTIWKSKVKNKIDMGKSKLIRSYNDYELTIIEENIEYWIDYVNENIGKLRKWNAATKYAKSVKLV